MFEDVRHLADPRVEGLKKYLLIYYAEYCDRQFEEIFEDIIEALCQPSCPLMLVERKNNAPSA